MKTWAQVKQDVQYTGDWYIVRVLGGREGEASDWLTARAGAECYYPVAQREDETKAAIPGYIFVKFESEPKWFEILTGRYRCFDVLGFFHNVDDLGKRPHMLQDAIINRIKDMERLGEFVKKEPTVDDILNGLLYTKFTIPFGPFVGHRGKIIAITNGVLRVRLRLLGAYCYMNLVYSDLFPVDSR